MATFYLCIEEVSGCISSKMARREFSIVIIFFLKHIHLFILCGKFEQIPNQNWIFYAICNDVFVLFY